MQNFKIGDVVEVDWSNPENNDLKNNMYFQGTMEVKSTNSEWLVFTHKHSGHECSAFSTRFKLVTPAKEVKPIKKPHAWAVVNKQDNLIDSIWTTRVQARNHRDGWESTYKVKKVFLEFAD